MSDPVRFLTSLGQALSALSLYSAGHPARERALEVSYEQLQLLTRTDPRPHFSFIDDEVLYRQQVLRDLHGWDWGRRLSKATVQRVEFDEVVSREEFEGFLADVFARLNRTAMDTAEARQLQRPSIRFGALSLKGATAEDAVSAITTATMAYTLHDEIVAVQWVHDQVGTRGALPLVEAEAVVRSLSLAIHSQSSIVLPLLQLKEFDQYTTTHATNVSVLAMALAEHLEFSSKDVRLFGVAGLLHDLGKVRIPKEILVKPGQFTAKEVEVMRQHPSEGARIILEREKNLDLAAVVAYEHHIMLNGQGYPSMRFKRECHYASRLVHVCDVYDALCTDRPYREAWPSEIALAYIEDRSGVEFDPQMVDGFVAMMRDVTYQRVVIPTEGEMSLEGFGLDEGDPGPTLPAPPPAPTA